MKVEDVISSELIGMAAEDISDIDYVLKEIDGTDNMSSIGGNTTVAVSMAAAKAAANYTIYHYTVSCVEIWLINYLIH